MAQSDEQNATLCVTMFGGTVDPLKCGSRVYVEIRLRDLTRRLDQVDVNPSTGQFSYDGYDGVLLNDNTLDEIYGDYLYIVLRSWHPTDGWTDAAQIVLPVETIDIREDRDFRSFVLEPVAEEFYTGEEDKPSLILSATLQSPFRPPLESVARLLQGYTNAVDLALDTVSQQIKRVKPFLSSRAALMPAIPVSILLVSSLPLLAVVVVIGLPLVVPIVAAAIAVGGLVGLLALAVWAGSRNGRTRIEGLLKPYKENFGKQDAEVLYPIGPRPSPARIARSLVPRTMWHKLAFSILVDFIGCTSYAVPLLGESADLLWAPVAYLLIDAMYHDSSPWAGLFGGVEEILPFTDIIPTATLAWLKENIPLMLGFARNMVARGAQQQQQQQQGSRDGGRVYHSNGDVTDGGASYASEPDPASS